MLTGAYQVNAGTIDAREIRGARIDAVGDIKSQVGITDSVISAQGDIYARYVHNSRIETFGNIYIENEIIDSQIFCSGRIDSNKCRAITSTLYGKKELSSQVLEVIKQRRVSLEPGQSIISLKRQELSVYCTYHQGARMCFCAAWDHRTTALAEMSSPVAWRLACVARSSGLTDWPVDVSG